MDKAQVLSMLDGERARFYATLGQISPERMVAPGANGEWTVKDIVAHISWTEREMVGVLRQRAMIGSALWRLSQDERNAAVYAEHREQSLDETLSAAPQIFAEFRAEIERLSDEELNNPALIKDIPGGITPWQLLSGAWTHYTEHLPALQAQADTVR